MSAGTAGLVAFLIFSLAALGGLFLWGWLRRKDKMPDVPPLPADDDDDWDTH